MNGAGSEPMEIPTTCRSYKLPQLKKILSRKLVPSFKEALSNVVLNFLFSSVHYVRNFVTAINCFPPLLKLKLISSLILFFRLLSGIFVYRVESYKLLLKVLCF